MALNLNKDNSNQQIPGSNNQKKGLNLSKSGEPGKTTLYLEKENISNDNNAISYSSESQSTSASENKKSPVVYILTGLILFGIALFWFLSNSDSQNGKNTEIPQSSNNSADTTVSNQTNEILSTNQMDTVTSTQTNAENQSLQQGNGQTDKTTTSAKPVVTESLATRDATFSENQSSIEEKTQQVIRGAFGNGSDRKAALGNEYSAIQKRVNDLYRIGIR
jgi:hypothetical protein